jgi:hypothetical protein
MRLWGDANATANVLPDASYAALAIDTAPLGSRTTSGYTRMRGTHSGRDGTGLRHGHT